MKIIIEQPELNKIIQAGLSYLRPELFGNGTIELRLVAQQVKDKVTFTIELDVPEKETKEQ